MTALRFEASLSSSANIQKRKSCNNHFKKTLSTQHAAVMTEAKTGSSSSTKHSTLPVFTPCPVYHYASRDEIMKLHALNTTGSNTHRPDLTKDLLLWLASLFSYKLLCHKVFADLSPALEQHRVPGQPLLIIWSKIFKNQ